MIMWACLVADHEGLALAQRYGLDIEMMRKALLTTHSTNGALEHWGKQTMAWADDDMEIVAAMAKEKGSRSARPTRCEDLPHAQAQTLQARPVRNKGMRDENGGDAYNVLPLLPEEG